MKVNKMKSRVLNSMKVLLPLLFIEPALAGVVSGDVSTYYENPYAGKSITSFNWGSNGNLYWLEGDSNWAEEMKAHQYDGSTLTTIYTASAYAGTWVLEYGDNIYFDNSSAYALYKYDTVAGGSAAQVFQQANAWGYTIHNDGLFIAGSDANWNAKMFYSALDTAGTLTGSVVDLGFMGGASGPVAFDASGNLFYAVGYGSGKIYRYSAAEVAAAIAGTPFSNPSAHEFIDFNSFGYAGATGMEFDANGHLVATLTAFGSPSSLVTFYIADDGSYMNASHIAAESTGPMTSVRNYQGQIYFNDDGGIYQLLPQTNTDGDRLPDAIDIDDDNDGVPDVSDAFSLDATEWLDTDVDGIGNNADGDDDNDGIPDAIDADPLDAGNTAEIKLPLNGPYRGTTIHDDVSVM